MLLALCACADAHEIPSPRTPEQLSALLVGDWRYAYVTAGTNAAYGRFVFSAGGELLVDTYVWGPQADRHVKTCAAGRYSVTPDRTVRYRWRTGSRENELAHSAVFVDPRLLAPSFSWSYIPAAQSYWLHRGLLATDSSLTRFAGKTAQSGTSDDGVVLSHRSASVELTFSSPPSSLPPDAQCELTLAITIEALVESAVVSRQASFVLPCSVRERDARFIEVVVSEWRVRDAEAMNLVPLAEAPAANSAQAWVEYLRAEGYEQRWTEQVLFNELTRSFAPDLLLDRGRPDALFPRYFDTNSPSPDVYTQVGPNTPADWWTSCMSQQ